MKVFDSNLGSSFKLHAFSIYPPNMLPSIDLMTVKVFGFPSQLSWKISELKPSLETILQLPFLRFSELTKFL